MSFSSSCVHLMFTVICITFSHCSKFFCTSRHKSFSSAALDFVHWLFSSFFYIISSSVEMREREWGWKINTRKLIKREREGGRKRNQKSLNILSAYSDCNDKSWVISLVIYFMSAERTRWILWGYLRVTLELIHHPQPQLLFDHFISSKIFDSIFHFHIQMNFTKKCWFLL